MSDLSLRVGDPVPSETFEQVLLNSERLRRERNDWMQEAAQLKARVEEQKIAFAEKLAGVTDASTRHVKQLSERVDELTSIVESKNADLRKLVSQLTRATVRAHNERARVDLLTTALTPFAQPGVDGIGAHEWYRSVANARAALSATPTSPRYVVQNRGAAWAVHDNERHMDISLYTDEQFTQEFCQRMNTTPTGSET